MQRRCKAANWNLSMASISLVDIQAQWAYSEIVDSNFEHWYDNSPEVGDFRAKRRAGMPFADLSPLDRCNLAGYCREKRSFMLEYVVSITTFDLVVLRREDIAALRVASNIAEDGRFHPFKEFMDIPSANSGDFRNVVCDTATYQPPADPLTIGHYNQRSVLLDGYHRAAVFWKCGASTGSLQGYNRR
jgi:hypothetical protein